MSSSSVAIPRSGDELSRLCGEVSSIVRRKWGRGPVRITARWAGPDMLVVLLENGHTDAEKALLAAGHVDHLVEGRRLLQRMVEDDLAASAARATGRPVQTVLAATRVRPNLSAEIFLFKPAAAGEAEDAPE
jgi:uncharacterized protein YbcI